MGTLQKNQKLKACFIIAFFISVLPCEAFSQNQESSEDSNQIQQKYVSAPAQEERESEEWENQRQNDFKASNQQLQILNPVLADNDQQAQTLESNQAQPETGSCNQDSDCVLVRADCCGCSSGGASIAVPISEKDTHNKNLNNHCEQNYPSGLLCLAWYRCGTFRARCIQSQCVAEEILNLEIIEHDIKEQSK